MSSKTIVFSHANGFPAGCYALLFEAWREAGWVVHALPQFAHDPAYPVTSNWPRLRDQLIDFIESTGDAPVVLVGHSLGGLVSLLAASKKPALLAGLVLLDAPVVSGWKARAMRITKALGLMHKVGPSKVSRRRRHVWPDRATVLAHFASKPKFAAWDARVLQAYVDCGFVETAEGQVTLGFTREVESTIYDTLPHHLDRLLARRPPRCAVGFIAGTDSEELRLSGLAGTQALVGERFMQIEGSHLFPFERPDETAAQVLSMIASL